MNQYDTGLDYAPKMRIDVKQSAKGNPSYWLETEIMGNSLKKHLCAKSIDEAIDKGIFEIRMYFSLLSSAHSDIEFSIEDIASVVDKELARSFMRAKTKAEVQILFDTMERIKKAGISIPSALSSYARVQAFLDEKEEFERRT